MVSTVAVGVDESATAGEAVKMAVEAARTEARLREEGLRCRTLADDGPPADVLVQLAEECGADILVVGNKGMQRRVLGSVPNAVTHKADCSVLVVKTT